MLTVTHEPHLMKRGLNLDSWITKKVASFVKKVAELSNEDTGGYLVTGICQKEGCNTDSVAMDTGKEANELIINLNITGLEPVITGL